METNPFEAEGYLSFLIGLRAGELGRSCECLVFCLWLRLRPPTDHGIHHGHDVVPGSCIAPR